mmetsp:Transcript_55928/g.121666  ORF Transcript_55928/g.121666 Transcript_55928/m.121666 type:complete len:226 (-) Transcript_55928:1696-2373(-)
MDGVIDAEPDQEHERHRLHYADGPSRRHDERHEGDEDAGDGGGRHEGERRRPREEEHSAKRNRHAQVDLLFELLQHQTLGNGRDPENASVVTARHFGRRLVVPVAHEVREIVVVRQSDRGWSRLLHVGEDTNACPEYVTSRVERHVMFERVHDRGIRGEKLEEGGADGVGREREVVQSLSRHAVVFVASVEPFLQMLWPALHGGVTVGETQDGRELDANESAHLQ